MKYKLTEKQWLNKGKNHFLMCNNIRTLILAALTLSQCYVEKKEVTEIGGVCGVRSEALK